MTEPKPVRRTRRAASSADPKTYTEAENRELIAKALHDQAANEQAAATRQAVVQLGARIDEVGHMVEKSNNLKSDILDVQQNLVESVTAHHEEVAAFAYKDWSLEEKRGLRPSVVDFLGRQMTRAFLASTWQRRALVAGVVIAGLTLLVTAAAAVYNAVHK